MVEAAGVEPAVSIESREVVDSVFARNARNAVNTNTVVQTLYKKSLYSKCAKQCAAGVFDDWCQWAVRARDQDLSRCVVRLSRTTTRDLLPLELEVGIPPPSAARVSKVVERIIAPNSIGYSYSTEIVRQ